MTAREILDTLIYPRLDRAALFAELSPKDRGTYVEVKCPKCGDGAAFIYKTGHVLVCNRRNKCGYKVSIWDYVQEKLHLSGKRDVLVELAKIAGVTLPNADYDISAWEAAKRRGSLWDTAADYFRDKLRTPDGADALAYLKARHYTDEDLEKMGVGFHPGQAEVKEHLLKAGFTDEEIYKSGVLTPGYGEAYRITVPYSTLSGRIEGVAVRTVGDPPEGMPKFKYNAGLSTAIPCNLRATGKPQDVVVVEGPLKALLLEARGIACAAVATGRNGIGRKQIEAMDQALVRRVYLCFDGDKAGLEGTTRAVEDLLRGGRITPLVVELSDAGCKGPDDYLIKHGADKFNEALAVAVHGARWRAKQILKEHDAATDAGRDAAIRAILDYDENVTDAVAGIYLIEELATATGIPVENLEDKARPVRERRAREKQEAAYRAAITEAGEMLEQGKVKEIEDYLIDKAARIGSMAMADKVGPMSVDAGLAAMTEAPAGMKTGYAALDAWVSFHPSELIVIGARSRHGKTTLAINLYTRMLEAHRAPLLFFSYETDLRRLTGKMIGSISGEAITEIERMRRENAPSEAMQEAIDKLKRYEREGSLFGVFNPRYTVEDVLSYSMHVKEKQGEVKAIFVDYLGLLAIKQEGENVEQQYAKIVNRLRIAAQELECPVFLLSQLNREVDKAGKLHGIPRLHHLRYSGQIEQEAATVLLLRNMTVEEAERGELEDRELGDGEDPMANVKVYIPKNRYGPIPHRPVDMVMRNGQRFEDAGE